MKIFIYLFFLLLPGFCQADTFILKDGARIEGEVTGEMDGVLLVKTKYGSLTINRADIQEQQAALAPAIISPAALIELSSAQPAAVAASTAAPAVEISTALPEAVIASTAAPAVGISTALPEEVVAPAPKLTFRTIIPSTMTRQLVYLEGGVAVATETFDAGGALVLTEGAISNGTYTEYYPDGSLKTVKTMMSGKANGTLKAFYPAGALQVEAYYLAGGREGPFKYYTGDGKLLMEAAYRNDLLNGWKKEYGADGAVTSATYYIDDRPAEPRKEPTAPGQGKQTAAEPESMVTAKVVRLARGELLSFRLNGKYIGKAHLDKGFNLISQEGKIPDGAVKIYTEDGKLLKELVFVKNALITLRAYDPGGLLKAEYYYIDNEAVKK
ncbi:MAG: hypothetical protein Q7R35_05075 [Elusimicrobiota bacterium]|nr:hypothetical protein [Elusimicrobiota bacterium]